MRRLLCCRFDETALIGGDYCLAMTTKPGTRLGRYGTNNQRIWKVEIDGADAVQVTDTETFFAVVSPDGKQFVGFYQDDPKAPVKLATFPTSGGQPVKTFSSPSGLGSTLRWDARQSLNRLCRRKRRRG